MLVAVSVAQTCRFGHNPEHARASNHPGHPLRRLRHAPVAGLARKLPQAALAADVRPHPDAGDRAARPRPGFAPPIVVCNQEHRFLIAEQLRAAGIADAAHRAGAGRPQQRPRDRRRRLLVAEDDPDAVLWMMAADAAIADTAALHRAWPSPRRPRAPAGSSPSACARPRRKPATATSSAATRCATRRASTRVARFVEKPDAATAAAPGRRRPASVELRHVRVHRRAPCWRSWRRMHRTCWPRCARRWRRAGPISTSSASAPTAFTASPSISLDYAVAERTSRAAVVPADIGWSDVGSWGALWELGAQGRSGQRRGRRRAAGGRAQLLRAQRRHAGRGGRAERRRGGGDRGRRAGDAPRPRAGREEGGGPAEGRRPARGGGA